MATMLTIPHGHHALLMATMLTIPLLMATMRANEAQRLNLKIKLGSRPLLPDLVDAVKVVRRRVRLDKLVVILCT